MNVDVADILLSLVEGGEVRVNIGDAPTGKGYGASIGYWGVDGFLSRPNAPTAAGNAQGWYVTEGQSRRVIASRDTRFVGPFSGLGEGDRAIVSDCDAGLHLDRAANLIKLQSNEAMITVDGANDKVVITKGLATITLSTVGALDTITLKVGSTEMNITVAGVDITGVLSVGGTPIVVP
jgi:hypothetical protein